MDNNYRDDSRFSYGSGFMPAPSDLSSDSSRQSDDTLIFSKPKQHSSAGSSLPPYPDEASGYGASAYGSYPYGYDAASYREDTGGYDAPVYCDEPGLFDEPVFRDEPDRTGTPQRKNKAFSINELKRLHDGGAPVREEVPVSRAVREAPPVRPTRSPARPRKKKKHRFLGFLGGLLIFLLVVGLLSSAFFFFSQRMPEAEDPLGVRKDGCCTVLLAGTDEGGIRTDTLILMYFNRADKEVRMLSIPRDTMVNRDNPVPKINGAYYANGAEEEGMDYLMDYVGDVVGYRPDGYVLINLECFEDLVDLMGGVEFDVPMDMHYEDPTQDLYIDLEEGKQTLNGEQAMWLVRFRSGYASGSDLERIDTQRDFVGAALDQWTRARNLVKAPAAVKLVEENTLTDLSRNEFLWLGYSAILCGKDHIETDTLPGEGQYVNGGAYYVEDREAAAELVNEYYNPYETEITADDLHPYGY